MKGFGYTDDGVGSSHAIHDHEDNEEDEPGILFVVKNGLETAEVDDTAAEGDDDTTKSRRHFAVRYSGESQT